MAPKTPGKKKKKNKPPKQAGHRHQTARRHNEATDTSGSIPESRPNKARRSWRRAFGLFGAALAGAAAVGSFVLPLWFAQPQITHPLPDSDVFRFPFRIRNPQYLTLHNVIGTCRIDRMEWTEGRGVYGGLGLYSDRPPAMLGYDASATYPCPALPSVDTAGVFGDAKDVTRIEVSFEVSYDIHFVPFWPSRGHQMRYYRVLRKADGMPEWIESSRPFLGSDWGD